MQWRNNRWQRQGSSFRNGSESGGKAFAVHRKSGSLKNWQAKQKQAKKTKTKQTNKQKSFKHLGSWTFLALMLKIQLPIKLLPYATHTLTYAHTFQSVGGQVPYFDPGFNAVYLKKCIDMHSILRSLRMGPDWHW